MCNGIRLFMPLLCCVLTSSALAQSSEKFIPHLLPTLDIRRTTGSIEIDGAVDDAGWQEAARADGFTETYPGDGVRPEVTTEVRITYDDYNLYVAFICQDDPKEVRAYLHDRDQWRYEDQVGIFIDTYDDADNAVALFANALGVQQDNFEGGGYKYDQFYYTAGKITGTGYQVELAIPFSSLRFPNTPTQNWRINFQRTRPRESGYVYKWAATSRDNSCLPCQYGTLTGLHDLQFDHQLELLPTVTAQDVTYFSRRSHSSELTTGASLTARYLPASNISISAGVAPEIGDLNVTEKTLWYRELSRWWSPLLPMAEFRLLKDDDRLTPSSPYNTILSGMDADAAAIVATGRFGRTSVNYQGGYLQNDGSRAGTIVQHHSIANEISVRQSLDDDSYIGASIHHTFWNDGGTSSAVGSAGQLRLLEHYMVWWDLSLNRTAEPVDSTTWNSDSPLNGEVLGAYIVSAGINHTTRHWNTQLHYIGDGAAFSSGSSPSFSSGGQSLAASIGYTIYPGSATIEQITPSITAYWSTEDNHDIERLHVAPSLWLLAEQQFSVWFQYSLDELRGGGNNTSYHSMDLSLWRNFGPRISLRTFAHYSQNYNDHRLEAQDLTLGLGGNVIPIPSLSIGWGLTYYGPTLTDQQAQRHNVGWANSISYQIMEPLSTMIEINFDGDDLDFNPFLVYRFNAYSSISFGSSHGFRKFSYDASILTETARQFFLKAQYLVGL